jgi:hypothetical protein
MENTHNIETILQSLKDNRVSINIIENEYCETNGEKYRSDKFGKNDMFIGMDDLMTEYKHMKSRTSLKYQQNQKKQYKNQTHSFQEKMPSLSSLSKLIYSLACLYQNDECKFILQCKKDITKKEYESIVQPFKNIVLEKIACLSNKYKISKKKLQNLYVEYCSDDSINNVDIFKEDIQEDIYNMLSFIGEIVQYNLILNNDNNKEIYIKVCNDFPVAKLSILHNNCIPYLKEVVPIQKVENDYVLQYNSDEIFLENLKTNSVKDLRQIAINIGIDLFSNNTTDEKKLYKKVELRQLIEAKVKLTKIVN